MQHHEVTDILGSSRRACDRVIHLLDTSSPFATRGRRGRLLPLVLNNSWTSGPYTHVAAYPALVPHEVYVGSDWKPHGWRHAVRCAAVRKWGNLRCLRRNATSRSFPAIDKTLCTEIIPYLPRCPDSITISPSAMTGPKRRAQKRREALAKQVVLVCRAGAKAHLTIPRELLRHIATFITPRLPRN